MNALEMIAALKGADEETAAELVERLQCGEIDCSVLPTGKDSAVQQAQIWAQEARTQKGIVEEIGKLVGCANDWETVFAVKAALSGAQQGEAIGWRKAKDGEHWPHIGGKYLIKLNGVLQHEVYEFDQGDDGMGGGEYFWDRDDLDEGAPFNPEKDEWLPIDEAGMPAAPQPAQVPEGWKPVPIEPTHVMEMEGAKAYRESKGGFYVRVKECYQAMLTAAPSGDAKREADKPINVDWPICNPACDPSLNGGTRSRGCVCEAAKASIARQSSDGDDSEGVE